MPLVLREKVSADWNFYSQWLGAGYRQNNPLSFFRRCKLEQSCIRVNQKCLMDFHFRLLKMIYYQTMHVLSVGRNWRISTISTERWKRPKQYICKVLSKKKRQISLKSIVSNQLISSPLSWNFHQPKMTRLIFWTWETFPMTLNTIVTILIKLKVQHNRWLILMENMI